MQYYFHLKYQDNAGGARQAIPKIHMEKLSCKTNPENSESIDW